MYQALKNLSATQQVGALFTIVFGILLLASVVAVLLSMRELGDSHRAEQQRGDLSNFEGVLRDQWACYCPVW